MTAATTTAPAPAYAHRLNAFDRCDRCGAQAYVEATSPTNGFTLLFCGHHSRTHEDALATSGFSFHDERDRLLAAAVQ